MPGGAEQHRIKRAEAICGVRCVDCARRISGLTVHKREGIVGKRIAGAQMNRLIKLAKGKNANEKTLLKGLQNLAAKCSDCHSKFRDD